MKLWNIGFSKIEPDQQPSNGSHKNIHVYFFVSVIIVTQWLFFFGGNDETKTKKANSQDGATKTTWPEDGEVDCIGTYNVDVTWPLWRHRDSLLFDISLRPIWIRGMFFVSSAHRLYAVLMSQVVVVRLSLRNCIYSSVSDLFSHFIHSLLYIPFLPQLRFH